MDKGLFVNQYELTKKDFFSIIEKMHEKGYRYLCILPVTESAYGKSPYSTDSAFSISDWFLDMPAYIREIEVDLDYDNYQPLFREYARYKAINKNNYTFTWQRWEDPEAASGEDIIYKRLIEKLQNITRIKKYLNRKGIWLIGDMIFGVHDSSFDVKKFNECFDMSHKIGTPYGNQRWEFCSYSQKAGRYFRIKLDIALKMFDMVRVDHNLGYKNMWVYRGDGDFTRRELNLEYLIDHPRVLYEEFDEDFPAEKTMAIETFLQEGSTLSWSITSNHDTFYPGINRKDIQSERRIFNLYELVKMESYIKFNNGYLDVSSVSLP